MSSLTSRLLTQDAAPPSPPAQRAAEPVPAGTGEGEGLDPANEAEREALQAAKTASDLSAKLLGQMEKTASEGGRVPAEAEQLRLTLEKLAWFVPELIRVAQARQKYAEYCLEKAVDGVSKEEAFKFASELVADGVIDMDDGKTVADVAEDLLHGEGGLPVVKRAVDLVVSGRLARLGSVEKNEKTASDHSVPIGDSDEEFLRRHSWLLP